VAFITLISFLPLALQLLLDESERQLMARASTTPLPRQSECLSDYGRYRRTKR
jgi:hypothetical protein